MAKLEEIIAGMAAAQITATMITCELLVENGQMDPAALIARYRREIDAADVQYGPGGIEMLRNILHRLEMKYSPPGSG